MPGTILVSVLEFMDLPLSSRSISVSMGKTEYLISEKGDFSFPLTSLREDFIVKLHDADGNEISRIGFHTRSIVEKGIWEDIFSLGQGHLHLKLQFILNDEERDRIRMLRQSALKKKHDELLSSSLRGAESSNISVGNAALTFRTNDEVSGLKRDTYNLKLFPKYKSPVGFQIDKKSGTENVLGAKPDLMQLHPNSADQYKETSSNKPMSQSVDLTKLQEKGLIKKPAFNPPSTKDPRRAINSEDMAILFRSSNQNELAVNNLIQSNSNSVRKMISAFERQTGLAQDMGSLIKPPPTEYQSGKTETKASSKAQHSGEEGTGNNGPVGFLQGRFKGTSLARELKQALVYIGESREQITSVSHVKESSSIKILNMQTDSKARNKFKVAHKSDTEEEKYSEDFMRKSTFELVTVSGKMTEKHSDRNHPSNVLDFRQGFRSNSSKEQKRRGNSFKSSCELCIQRDSPHKQNSVVHFDDNYCSLESSGAWIFPDEPRKFCITTGGKDVMALLDSLVTNRISHQRCLDYSILENMEKNATYSGTGAEVSKHEKIDEVEESKSKNSDDHGDEISGGPVKQVIRVAIIIGFGILVLLTRQRKGR